MASVFYLHSVNFGFQIGGKWLLDTHFLNWSFSVYIGMIIGVFPLLSVLPYYYANDFPDVSRTKKVILAVLAIGNELAVLTYTALIHYWFG